MPKGHPLFDSKIGSEYGKRGAKAREAMISELRRKADAFDRLKLETVSNLTLTPADSAGPSEEYLALRLGRVRKQITLLEVKIESFLMANDDGESATAIDRLCAAKAKLSEEERVLSGRPLPGSHRPSKSPQKSREMSTGPLDISSTDPS
jgi:hypothetical protein